MAIVGIACRFPGADNLQQFWDLVHTGACAIQELPPDRLDRSLYFNSAKGFVGKSYSLLGGIVATPSFDPRLCAEPDAYDTAHLILLDVVANACRDAGWDPLAVPFRNAGVYIGHARTSSLAAEITLSTHVEHCVEYLNQVDAFRRLPESLRRSIEEDLICNIRRDRRHFVESGKPFASPGTAATLVAETLGLTGPRMVIDAACASSLVALALADRPLQEGRIDMAIVGGASFSNWQSLVLFSRAQALSASGSYPFDARADGFVSSDGYAALILKTLNRALSDRDRIYGVIPGIGLSSDGRGKSLWAPRKEGQVEAIRRAYSDGLDLSRIGYIEAHGTSTRLGDATELESLNEVLSPVLPPGRRIPIASVKGNIGHTCETAGLAGLIKAILAIRHGIIPPAAGFEHPSPEIDMDRLPFHIPEKPIEWPAADGHFRRAAVDAFGIGGLNAHVVVDQFVPSEPLSITVPGDAGGQGNEEIAIIGAGAIFPGAGSADEFWDLLASGRDPKTEVPPERWNPRIYWSPEGISPWRSPCRTGGFINEFRLDPLKFRIPPKQAETSDPLQYMVLHAADQALRDAGYENRPFDRRRTAVIVGTMFCSDFMRNLTVALQYPEFEKELKRLLEERDLTGKTVHCILEGASDNFHQHKPMLKDETGSFSASTLASRVARTLNLMGGAFSLDSEEASSGAVLDAAASLLRSGACDLVLCAGAQRSMDIGIYEEYALRGLLSADGQGFIPSEGTGMLLLKRAADARKDSDRIRGILKEIRTGSGKAAFMLDPVAKQMGHALGASGVSSVLAAIAPDAADTATVNIATARGFSYHIEIEKRPSQYRAAFLFPGQGSQYTGMLLGLVRESSAAASKLHEIDTTMKKLGYQGFSEIAWESGSGLGTEPWQTQISMLFADLIVLAALEDLGVRPDVVAGHSYGEFAALVAAESMTLEQAILATRARVGLVQSSVGGNCRLMATNAPANAARRIIGDSRPAVHLAILNSADQTILGGSGADLEDIASHFKAEGFYCTLLSLPGAFHTPLFADMRRPFLKALQSILIQPPRVPLLSSVTVRYVAEPAEIRENLAAQTSVLLNYPEMVRRLAADGINVFIEVGPQQVLTKLNRRILGERAITVACDNPQKPGLDSLEQIITVLKGCGVELSSRVKRTASEESRAVLKHEILFFDATQRRRDKNLHRAEMPEMDEAQARESALAGVTDWSAYLIQFVCEQTGYAQEVIDLDSDLESDLGIDSIKKMQLFSELRERFDFSGFQPSTLASFSTLRHVLDFLQENAKQKDAGMICLEPGNGREDIPTMKILRLRGSPYKMGIEHGKKQAEEIRTIVHKYNEVLGGNAIHREDLKIAMSRLNAYFSDSSLEELRGLADGAGMPLEILAGLNLALMPELISGCSHFAFACHLDGAWEILHGTNEDSPLLMTLGRAMAPTALVRHPDKGIPHLTFVLPGQFAGINGINAMGVAVSSTLLLDRLQTDAMPSGRTHGDLVKEILESAEDVESAIQVIRRARRVGGWGLLISHEEKRKLCYLEYDEQTVTVDSQTNYVVGANHALLGSTSKDNRVPEHSVDRRNRLEALLNPNGTRVSSFEAVRAALRDCHAAGRDSSVPRPTMSTVRRVDNLMSMIMRPQQNEVWVAAGVHAETYQRLDLTELFHPHIMRRWVLRTVPAPALSSGPLQIRGASLIVGNNPASEAVQSQISNSGADRVDRMETPEAALEFLEHRWDSNPVRHLFLMSGMDSSVPDVLSIYRLCQAWVERIQKTNLLLGATLVAGTNLGGDFGFSGHIGNVECGGLTGLLKAIRREFPGLKTKIIDAPRDEAPDRVASAILRELGADSTDTEIGYRLGKRLAVRAFQRPARSGLPVSITRGGAWIVTGGSRGITAEVARALVEKYDLKVHVLGRSASADLQYPGTYHGCNVSDPETLGIVIRQIRQESGPILGILHGAGIEAAARFGRKDMENVQATIASKFNGALHLTQLTMHDPLEVFIAFGSISGRFGGHGQTDYSLASDMLAKLVQRFRAERPECASVAFHWPAWDEIGMAMRAESHAALELAGQKLMPPTEGLEHLWAEIDAGAPEGEVLILDGPGTLCLDGCMQAPFAAEQKPLIEGSLIREPRHHLAEIRFDPATDPFLREHCYQGIPLLPAAVGLEALAEGAGLTGGEGLLTLQDVEIRNGLRFKNRHSIWVRVAADQCPEGTECRLISEFRNRQGKLIDPERVLISGKVRLDAALPPERSDVASGAWHPVQYPGNGPLIHGLSFQCLKEIAFEEEKFCGRVLAQASDKLGGARRGAWLLPIAELDACLVACGAFGLQKTGALALPSAFERLCVFRQPNGGEICEVHGVWRGRQDSTLRFDFVLYGTDGAAILQADGFCAAMLGQERNL